jgi:hypothetical protein
VVVFAGYTPAEGGGTTISIEHQGGMRTTYLHLTKLKVAEGQAVAQGQELGSSDGSPLHFGMKIAGAREIYFNPVTYLVTPESPASSPDPAAETGAGTEAIPAYPVMPVPDAPAAPSSADSAAVVPVSIIVESTVAASETIPESRPGEVTGFAGTAAPGYEGISTNRVQASSPDQAAGIRLAGLENLIPESTGAGTATPVISGLLTPFSAGTISTLEKSGDTATSNKQNSIAAGGNSPLRNLLLTALLLMVTAGGGCMGKMAGLKPVLARGSAACQPSH